MLFREKNNDGIELYINVEERKLLHKALKYYALYHEQSNSAVNIADIIAVLQLPEYEITDDVRTLEEKDVVFYTTKDIAAMFNCSEPTARKLMQRDDFPLVKIANKLVVHQSAFEEWAACRRV